jgi:hypothetical protein
MRTETLCPSSKARCGDTDKEVISKAGLEARPTGVGPPMAGPVGRAVVTPATTMASTSWPVKRRRPHRPEPGDRRWVLRRPPTPPA